MLYGHRPGSSCCSASNDGAGRTAYNGPDGTTNDSTGDGAACCSS
jgi:hypothetical protein